MILRYILQGILEIPLYIIGLVITPLNYVVKDYVRKYNIIPLWWFLNDTTEGKDAGDYGRFEHTFKGFYMQNAIRNSHWNLRLKMSPKKGVKENVKGELLWRNYTIKGWQFATYKIDGTKYFRWSFSVGWFYFQLGASDDRFI